MEIDYSFTCPHCWQEVIMRLDLSGGSQRYIEDCPGCCNPLEIVFRVEDYKVVEFDAYGIDQ